MPSAYGTARVMINGAPVTLPDSASRWTSFGASSDGVVANARTLTRLKRGATRQGICDGIAAKVVERLGR